MQATNKFLNICEYQTVSAIMRLLMTNWHFHKNKPGTEEPQAEEYIRNMCKILNIDPDDTTYNEIRKIIKTRH